MSPCRSATVAPGHPCRWGVPSTEYSSARPARDETPGHALGIEICPVGEVAQDTCRCLGQRLADPAVFPMCSRLFIQPLIGFQSFPHFFAIVVCLKSVDFTDTPLRPVMRIDAGDFIYDGDAVLQVVSQRMQ